MADRTISDNEAKIMAALYNANGFITIEKLAQKVELSVTDVVSFIKYLALTRDVELQRRNNHVSCKLSRMTRDELSEHFNAFDKDIVGKHDDISYLSGRLFAAADRALTEYNGKGLTKQQFEMACLHPLMVFVNVFLPVLKELDKDMRFGSELRVLLERIGTLENGVTKMPLHLGKSEAEMFKLGFDEMYDTMVKFDEMEEVP